MQKEKSDSLELESIKVQIEGLSQRIAHIEKKLGNKANFLINDNTSENENDDFEVKFPFQQKGSFEFGVGEIGMAWLGNIILFFGLVFLVGYLQSNGNRWLPTLAGFISVLFIYAGAYFSKGNFKFLSRLLHYNAHILLFYMSLQLHFLHSNPILKNETTGLLCVLLVVVVLFVLAVKQRNPIFTGLVLIMLLITGVMYQSKIFMATSSFVSVAATVYLYYKLGWLKLSFLFIFVSYLIHLNWLIGNPLCGNTPAFIDSPGIAYIVFIATGFVVSLLALIPKHKNISGEFVIAALVWNGIGFTLLLALVVFTFFIESYVFIFTSIAVFCMIYALLLKKKSEINISAPMYVLYGFLAGSVAIYGTFNLPDSYVFFAWQSLIVVGFALWFQSRFMIVMNTLLYLLFFGFYLQNPEHIHATNLSFMLVAFISARTINWKKDRLNIKTEYIRNIYLLSGLTGALVSFYFLSPQGYITASWILVALVLFVFSLLIKNIKYRWLAITTMVVAAMRLIFIDMKAVDIGYRVLVFLALAIFSLIVSVLYTRFYNKK